MILYVYVGLTLIGPIIGSNIGSILPDWYYVNKLIKIQMGLNMWMEDPNKKEENLKIELLERELWENKDEDDSIIEKKWLEKKERWLEMMEKKERLLETIDNFKFRKILRKNNNELKSFDNEMLDLIKISIHENKPMSYYDKSILNNLELYKNKLGKMNMDNTLKKEFIGDINKLLKENKGNEIINKLINKNIELNNNKVNYEELPKNILEKIYDIENKNPNSIKRIGNLWYTNYNENSGRICKYIETKNNVITSSNNWYNINEMLNITPYFKEMSDVNEIMLSLYV